MDNSILKKRLSTFKTSKGTLTKVSDDLLFDIIREWEEWTGTSTDLAKELGVHVKQLAFLIRKAKTLHREGRFPEIDFKEIKLETPIMPSGVSGPCNGAEVVWNDGKVIRFFQVDLLIDFLKKAA